MIGHSSPSSPEATRSRLRATLANIDLELSHMIQVPPVAPDAAVDRLRTALAELVGALALGPEPLLRECPSCRHHGLRAATRCGYCWSKLVPPLVGMQASG